MKEAVTNLKTIQTHAPKNFVITRTQIIASRNQGLDSERSHTERDSSEKAHILGIAFRYSANDSL